MTDRVNSFVVILDKDMRIDDAQNTITALQQIKGVISVVPQISSPEDVVHAQRVVTQVADKLVNFVKTEVLQWKG